MNRNTFPRLLRCCVVVVLAWKDDVLSPPARTPFFLVLYVVLALFVDCFTRNTTRV